MFAVDSLRPDGAVALHVCKLQALHACGTLLFDYMCNYAAHLRGSTHNLQACAMVSSVYAMLCSTRRCSCGSAQQRAQRAVWLRPEGSRLHVA